MSLSFKQFGRLPSTQTKEVESKADRSTAFKSSLNQILLNVAIALVYFAAAKLGLSLALIHANVSPVWPPTGLAISSILLFGYGVWPGILVGAFAASSLLTSTALPIDAMISIGNTLEAVGAVFLLNRLGFRHTIDRANDVFKFVLASLLGATISASIGTLSLCVGHAANWDAFTGLWSTWWLGDSVGALVVTPLILAWSGPLPRKRRLEGLLVITLLTISALAAFGGPHPISIRYYPFARLMVPFFLWVAFRLGTRGVTLSSLLLSIAAVLGTANGTGPFSGGPPNDSLMILQVFLGTNAVMFLFLVATVEERTNAFRGLSRSQRQMAASLEVTRILSDSENFGTATSRILPTVCNTLDWEIGAMWALEVDRGSLWCKGYWSKSPRKFSEFESATRALGLARGVGLPGRVWSTLRAAWITDIANDPNFPRASIAAVNGLRSAFAFPITSRDQLLGVMEFFSKESRDPDNDLIARFVGVGSQIGQFVERKRAEQERERLLSREHAARSEAEIANKAKDEFLAVVSHELRTPLNAIVGWAGMLRSGELSGERVKQAIEIIDRNAKAQTQLIEDILDVSRIISGKFQLDRRPVQIAQVVKSAVEAIRPTADLKNIRIKTVLGSHSGPVAGDSVRLQQVVWNLLSNAVKFSTVGGEILVDVSGDHSAVRIVVADSGEGIPREFLPLIFERFRQVDSSNSRRHGGLGLGLAIVRHLVELHGGTVKAQSDGPGRGSVFTVSLPCIGEPEVMLRSVVVPSDDHLHLSGKQLSDIRILSVEDDPDARTMLDTVLREQGAEVISVGSVSEALEVLNSKERLPRLLISDLGMPVSDGFDLIRELRAKPVDSGGEMPAIAISGYAANEDVQRALKAGYQMHLKKPVNWDELIAAITKFARQT